MSTQQVQTQTKAAAPAPKQRSLIEKFASKYKVEPNKLLATLKATCFKPGKNQAPVSNEEMMTLLIVADQHNLNPFLKEIFAFPDKKNGIVPVVSVDGWSRIINTHPDFNGAEFRYSEEMVEMAGAKASPAWCEAVIYRKSRDHPMVIREYLDEVYREPFEGKFGVVNGAWQSHTKRMLRHKALIQGARVAFGFSGIYDEDEARRIAEGAVDITDNVTFVNAADMPSANKKADAKLDALAGGEPAQEQEQAPTTTDPVEFILHDLVDDTHIACDLAEDWLSGLESMLDHSGDLKADWKANEEVFTAILNTGLHNDRCQELESTLKKHLAAMDEITESQAADEAKKVDV